MAKNIRRLVVLVMILALSISTIAMPAFAKGGPGGNQGSGTEYITINVNGAHLKTISGDNGDHTWLVQGTYKYSYSMSGNVLSYTVGKQSGSVTIPMPAGFEDCTAADVNATCTWGGGTNSQSAQYDNAVINVTFTKVVTPGGEIVDITDPTEPEPTDPPATEPEPTDPPVTEPEPTDPPAPVDYEPALSVVKTAAKATYKEGETVSWTITVKNTSAYTAYNVAISDDLTGDSWSIASLAPGAEQSFTATLANAAAGTIKNVVVVSWDDGDEIPNENEPEEPKTTSDEETVEVEEPINYTPVLSVVKTADKATYETGETITWTITVKNVSEYTAYNVAITDELTGDSWSIASLAPGAEQSFTTTTENAAAGSVKNVAVATWEDGDEIPDEEEPNEIKQTGDDEIVVVNDPEPENYIPVLDVIKTAGKELYKEGEAITWTITVKNVSDYTAYNVVIVDELAKGYWTIDSLAPGAEQTFTATMENVAAGSVKNVAVVTWEDGDEIPDEDEDNEVKKTSDEEIVTVEEPENFKPVLSVVKTADKAAYEVGETITWTITVKNISDFPAYDVSVVDEVTGDEWNIEVLAAGEEKAFTITMEAEAEGTMTNVVVVNWDDGDEIPNEEETDEPKETTDEETVTVNEPEPPVEETDPPVEETDPPVKETDPPVEETEPADIPVVLNDEIEIPDEDVPLADAPKTGDISALWMALSGISAAGMIVLGKKREEDEE